MVAESVCHRRSGNVDENFGWACLVKCGIETLQIVESDKKKRKEREHDWETIHQANKISLQTSGQTWYKTRRQRGGPWSIEVTELEASGKLHIKSVARNLHETQDLSTKYKKEGITRLIKGDKDRKFLEVAEVKPTTEEQKEQESKFGEETLWIKPFSFHKGGRYRRNQSGNPGNTQSGNTRWHTRSMSRGYTRPHNRCFTCDSNKH